MTTAKSDTDPGALGRCRSSVGAWQPLLRRAGKALLAALAMTPGGAMAAQITVFSDLYDYPEPLGIGVARAAIANNGTVVFLDVVDFGGTGKIVAVDTNGVHVLAEPSGPLTVLNTSFPGISDNGEHVAFRLRESVGSGIPIDRIYRTTIGGPLIKVAEPGDIAVASSDPIGATLCPSSCNVLNDGSVYFETFFPATLAFGDGGDIETFALADELGITFIEDPRASNTGLAAAIFQTGVNNIDPVVRQEFIIGTRETKDPSDPDYDPNKAANANVFLDSDGIYEEFRFPIVTDDTGIAVLALRDTGGQDILTRLAGEELLPKITTDGFYDSFDRLSFSKNGDIAFLATIDVPGAGEAIYTGADPIADRLIGPGDVLFGKTVTRVELAPYDAVNDAGQIAFAVRFAEDTSKIVKAVPIDPAKLFAYKAQVSTGSGGVGGLSQMVAVPGGLFDLSFELERLAGDAVLDLFFGGQLLQRFGNDIFGPISFEVDPFAIFGSDLPAMAELGFRLDGGPGTTLRIGDVDMPGLFNGDFSRGYLDGWAIQAEAGAFVSASAVLAPAPVPLPAGLLLLSGAPLCLASVRLQSFPDSTGVS